MYVPCNYNVCIAYIQGAHCIYSMYEFFKSCNTIFSKCYQDEAASCNHYEWINMNGLLCRILLIRAPVLYYYVMCSIMSGAGQFVY